MFAIALAAALLQATDWTKPTSLYLNGTELFGGGAGKGFMLEVEGTKTFVITNRGIGSWPGTGSRAEISTGKGIFTWMNDEVGSRVLALPTASQRDVPVWSSPVRFSKDAIQKGEVKDWKLTGSEKLAGRDCFVVTSLTPPIQKLWIDKETGVTLRQQDSDTAGSVFYERNAIEARFGLQIPAQRFEVPVNCFTIWGVPDPSILVAKSLDRPYKDYAKDLEAVKKKSKLLPESWLQQVPEIPGFAYAQTVFHEKQGKPVATIWPTNRLGAPEIEPGGLPAGWTMDASVNDDGNLLLNFGSPEGGNPRVLIKLPDDQGGTSKFNITMQSDSGETTSLSYSAFYGADGALVITPGFDVNEARTRREQRRLDLSKANVVVQSDFVDATGQTVSFIQIRGRDWKGALLWPRLPEPANVDFGPLAKAKSYAITGSFPLKMLVWDYNATTYILASSTLDLDKLLDVARHCNLVGVKSN